MIYRFNIEAVAACRMTQGQIKLIKIPDAKLSKEKLAVKNRILKYFNFKTSIQWMAKEQNFILPNVFGVTFFIHKEGLESIGCIEHNAKPDLSNLLKALEDALHPKDQAIYRITELSKYWVDGPSQIVITT